MQRQPEPNRSAKLERNVQNIANIATIAGAVVALLSDQLIWLLPAFAAFALVLFAINHRRWGAAAMSLIIVVCAGFVGISSYLNWDMRKFVPAPILTTSQTTSQTETTQPQITATTQSKESRTPDTLFDGEVTLDRYDSVDVDTSPAQIVHDQNGAVGEGDLYFDPSGLPGALYAYGSSPVYIASLGVSDPEQAYVTCTSNRNTSPFGFLLKGSAICFKTSQGHMAWAVVAAMSQPLLSEPAVSVTLRMIVWNS